MGIGTSLGAFYQDEHHYNSVLWDPERFQGDELMVKTPNQTTIDKQLDDAELDPTSGMGIEVSMKAAKPNLDSSDPFGGDEKVYGNLIDRRETEGIYPDIRDATSVPLVPRIMEFFGVNSGMFDTNLPPHTGEPLKKDIGYNDVRKPTKEEVEKFKRDIENMNSPAEPHPGEGQDLIGELIDKLDKK